MMRAAPGTPIRQRLADKATIEASACWLWRGALNACGYGMIGIDGRCLLAHRVAFAEYVGPTPRGQSVCHRCDRPACINPAHLFLGTHADNMADCRAKGRYAPMAGEINPNVKLSAAQIKQIRKLGSRHLTQAEIASRFGVTQSHVSAILRRASWSQER